MTYRASVLLAVGLLLGARAGLAARCSSTQPPADLGIDLATQDRCDPFVPEQCLLPYPNDYFTVRDRTPTGRRVALVRESLPANTDGSHLDADELNHSDGFSPGAGLLAWAPGLDLGRSTVPPLT